MTIHLHIFTHTYQNKDLHIYTPVQLEIHSAQHVGDTHLHTFTHTYIHTCSDKDS